MLRTGTVKSTTESSSLRVTCQWVCELWVSVGTFDTSDNNAGFFAWGRRGRNRMLAGITTTYAISVYHR